LQAAFICRWKILKKRLEGQYIEPCLLKPVFETYLQEKMEGEGRGWRVSKNEGFVKHIPPDISLHHRDHRRIK
jgi:hypothetical protein